VEVNEMKTIKTVWVNVYQCENMIKCGGTWPSLDDAEKNFDLSGGRKYLGARPICIEIDEPEPKKPKLLAPCFYMSTMSGVKLSYCLYESEAQARTNCLNFISWPAVANAEGFYEVSE